MKVALEDFLKFQLRFKFPARLLDDMIRVGVNKEFSWNGRQYAPGVPAWKVGARAGDTLEVPASIAKKWAAEGLAGPLTTNRVGGPYNHYEVLAGDEKYDGFTPWIKPDFGPYGSLPPTDYDHLWLPVRERPHGSVMEPFGPIIFLEFWNYQRAPLKGSLPWLGSSICIDLEPFGNLTRELRRDAA